MPLSYQDLANSTIMSFSFLLSCFLYSMAIAFGMPSFEEVNLEDVCDKGMNCIPQNILPKKSSMEDWRNIKTIHLMSPFTPRLGRSVARSAWERRSYANPIPLNAGSAFTPRLGRSEDNRMFLNAGNSFTPRLGRSNPDNDFSSQRMQS